MQSTEEPACVWNPIIESSDSLQEADPMSFIKIAQNVHLKGRGLIVTKMYVAKIVKGSSPLTCSNILRKLLFQAHVKMMRRGCNELQNNQCFCLRGPWAILYLLEIVRAHKSCDHGAMISGCWQCDSRGRHESLLLHIGESWAKSTLS